MSSSAPAQPLPLRVLFCIGITQTFFEQPRDRIPEIFAAFKAAFSDLDRRFGIRVLGMLDDDRIQVGHSMSQPWTSYIMADVPDVDTIIRICDQLRSTPVGDGLLWRYARIDTRIGRGVSQELGGNA